MMYKKIIIFLNACILLYIIFYFTTKQNLTIISSRVGLQHMTKNISTEPPITIVSVACGQRLPEILNMIKSAILFNLNGPTLNFVIIAEQKLHIGLYEKLTDWQEFLPKKFTFNILQLKFPEKNAKEWKSLFKPCASQRLFLPSLLKNTDSVLYMDTDTLFLSPVTEIWEHFKKFNLSQIAALSPEHMDKNIGWYNRFARHPFYGELGVNSGVMLMNLTRMRLFQWEKHILPLHEKYKLKITFGDQDLINILFFFHPDKLYLLPCEYNYRPDHCMYMSVCNAPNGIHVMHGNRGYFHYNAQPAFSTVYNSIATYQFGKDPYRNFLLNLDAELSLELVTNTTCGKVKNLILMKAKKLFIEQEYYIYNR